MPASAVSHWAVLHMACEITSSEDESRNVWEVVCESWIDQTARAKFDTAFHNPQGITVFSPGETGRWWIHPYTPGLGGNCAHFAAIITGLHPAHTLWLLLGPHDLADEVEKFRSNEWHEYLNGQYFNLGIRACPCDLCAGARNRK